MGTVIDDIISLIVAYTRVVGPSDPWTSRLSSGPCDDVPRLHCRVSAIDQLGAANLRFETNYRHPTSTWHGPATRATARHESFRTNLASFDPASMRTIPQHSGAPVQQPGQTLWLSSRPIRLAVRVLQLAHSQACASPISAGWESGR